MMAAVMIGVDPHKGSHTAVAIGADEVPAGLVRVRACAAQAEQDPALAQLKQAWADGGYHGPSAEGGTWCAVSSAGEVLTGGTPDALDKAIRAHWQAMQ